MTTTQEAVRTTQQVADQLVQFCREGKYEEAQNELFSEDAESIEPASAQGLQSVKGLDKIRKKGQDFQNMLETVHGGNISDPIVAGKFFAVEMSIDATYKGMGRQKMDEIAVYETQDGKIVKEQFFF